MASIHHPRAAFALSILGCALYLSLGTARTAQAATPTVAFPGGVAYIGDEVAGVAGPTPVNCTDTTYEQAQPRLDAQREAWVAAATSARPGSVPLGSLLQGPSGTAINTPLVLTQPDSFAITVTPIDLSPTQVRNSGANTTGAPSFTNVLINGSPTGCTMQDNAPRPSSVVGGDFYFNQLNNLRGLNGVRFTFSEPVYAFGAFFGDLETSARGTVAFMRLLDAAGNLLADIPISSTLYLNGGITAENAQCSLSNTPGAEVAAQGLLPGCGNGTTRWLGFVTATPVAQVLVVVGDNDPLPNGKGFTEKLSFMGPTVVRALPPTEVTIAKTAPLSVTVGAPFAYVLTLTNPSHTLAAGIIVTDSAPAGLALNAVDGPGCTLANNQLVCRLATLASGATATISLQATAQVTGTIANSAMVTATNDSNPANNSATALITSLAAPPLTACATPPTSAGAPLIINEIMYRQQASDGNDEWVELYARQALDGGAHFYLSDNESGSTEFKLAFTIPTSGVPASTYLVIHRITGTDDPDASDGVLQFYGAGSGSTSLKLNDSGDNLTLYQGTNSSGFVLDYVAYGSSSAVNGPGTGWSAPNAPATAVSGQSIAVIHNGLDTTSGNDWALAGSSATLGPATPGVNNNGKTACNIAITKQGPLTSVLGQPFDYTLTLSNTTGITMTGVVVTDTQPAGLKFNHVTGTGCNLAHGLVTCALGSLSPHATSTITVNATASTTGVLTNTAATHALSDTIALDNQATVTTTFLNLGAIGDFVYLDANQNGLQDPGENTPLNGIPVTLTFPDGHFTTTVTVDGQYLFPSLLPGVYTVTVGSAPGYVRTSTNAYPVQLGAGEVYVQADFGFVYQEVQVTLAKQGTAQVGLGQAFPYTLTVANTDSVTPALDVVVMDSQPSGVLFEQVNDERCSFYAGQVTCNLGNVAPNTNTQIVITATAQTAGRWQNTAFITATNAVRDVQATFATTVTAQADLQLVKTVNQAIAQPGDVLTFTLTLTNHGPNLATAVQVRDQLPASLLFLSAQPQQGNYDPATGRWEVGDVPVNAHLTLVIVVSVR